MKQKLRLKKKYRNTDPLRHIKNWTAKKGDLGYIGKDKPNFIYACKSIGKEELKRMFESSVPEGWTVSMGEDK